MIALPSCKCIETVPSIEMTLGFHFPKVRVLMLRELIADPMCVACAPSCSQSYSAYSSFNTPNESPTNKW